MTRNTREPVRQPEWNNTFEKMIIDTYRDEYAIVTDTEDLIIECCVRERAIINLSRGTKAQKPILQDAKATSKILN